MLGSFVCIGLKSTSRKRTLGDIEEIHGLRVENFKTINDLKIEFCENDDLAARINKLKTFCGFLKAGDLIVVYDVEVSLALLFRDLNLCIKRGPYFSTVAYISLYDALQDFYKANKKEEEQNFDDFIGFDEVVLDADVNAAINILARLYDKEINLYTSAEKVKEILIHRAEAVLLASVETAQLGLQQVIPVNLELPAKSGLSKKLNKNLTKAG